MDGVFPKTMQQMDRRTIDHIGTPGVVLMDRASRGAVEILVEHLGLTSPCRPLFLCGPGNNGGDGLAMATLLHHGGHRPRCLLLSSADELSDDGSTYFRIATNLGIPIDIADNDADLRSQLAGYDDHCFDFVGDALLGTGLDRPLEGRFRRAVDWLCGQSSPIVAVDIPTGLDGKSGQVLGAAARADLTTTFGFAKTGQLLDPGRQYCGHLAVIDIGIPPEVRDHIGVDARVLDLPWLMTHTSRRAPDLHKGNAGRTLMVGGRPPTPGAILLASRAALVGGAGLVTVATDARTAMMAPQRTPEIMGQAIIDEDRQLCERRLQSLLQGTDGAVIGPGLGTDARAEAILDLCLSEESTSFVLDADALNVLASRGPAGHRDIRQVADHLPCILTPHPAEMARLLDRPIADVLSSPIESTQALAQSTSAVVIHKSAVTVVADPDDQLAINRTGNPGMATGGMGDALAGLCASALCEFTDPFEAACHAVALHGTAGDRAAAHRGQRGLTVEALLDEIPSLWQSLER